MRGLSPLTLALAAIAAALKAPPREPPRDEPNTYGLPEGDDLAAELRRWFREQLGAVVGTVPDLGADPPTHFAPLTDYDDPMAAAMAPLIGAYWDEAGRRLRERIGLDPGTWRVTNPHVAEQVRGAAFAFCRATNRTTSKHLDTALADLRQGLIDGVYHQGDSVRELTKRVNQVFEHAEKWRARRIATSEASRAVHAAELVSAEESGVVAGLEWLVSADACPLCQQVASEARRVRLGQAFARVGHDAAYSTIRHPPLHPGCMCSTACVLKPEYGGPEDVDWGTTLDQPDGEPAGGEAPPRPPGPRPGARERGPKSYHVPALPGVAFVPSGASRDAGEAVVWVNTADLDAAWRAADPETYIAPGGGEGGKPGAYANARRFLAETARREAIAVELGRIGLDARGLLYFLDGRHRFAVLRDLGIDRIPIGVARDSAARVRRRFGTPHEPTPRR